MSANDHDVKMAFEYCKNDLQERLKMFYDKKNITIGEILETENFNANNSFEELDSKLNNENSFSEILDSVIERCNSIGELIIAVMAVTTALERRKNPIHSLLHGSDMLLPLLLMMLKHK